MYGIGSFPSTEEVLLFDTSEEGVQRWGNVNLEKGQEKKTENKRKHFSSSHLNLPRFLIEIISLWLDQLIYNHLSLGLLQVS